MTALDLLVLVAHVVLVAWSMRHLLIVMSGTSQHYLEWSQGLGGFLYISSLVIALAGFSHIIPDRDLSYVLGLTGVAFMSVPYVLHWLAPRLYNRLTGVNNVS